MVSPIVQLGVTSSSSIETGLPLIHTSSSTSQPPLTALITHRDVGISQPHTISDVNLLGKLTQASLANYGWLNDNDPHNDFSGIDDGNNSSGSEFQESNLGFTDDEDSNNVSNEGSDDAAQDTNIDPGLQDDTINCDKNLQDRPLSLDQKKVSQALWGQYMMVVNWLAKDWGIRHTWILIGGETLKDWNTQMKAEYAALFEGLDDNEAATKKESLHAALHEK
ncbi:hypothetical protein BS47DRAFT_1357675 [Hydnum rufescens UP504]|uniref:Uncharacterized protein n=1 Tax=Hydnum rufescens UP504 TaxID=1448309 RepID=A0A9P6B9V9_9AGAM|nr:hypothetical protein BS47DRAFT_1357675 [Hydnum rufescens UP504]